MAAGKEEVHGELARVCTRGMHTCTLAHLHTDSGSGDACWNPCAGIRVQESAGICTNGPGFMAIEVASLSFSSSKTYFI